MLKMGLGVWRLLQATRVLEVTLHVVLRDFSGIEDQIKIKCIISITFMKLGQGSYAL